MDAYRTPVSAVAARFDRETARVRDGNWCHRVMIVTEPPEPPPFACICPVTPFTVAPEPTTKLSAGAVTVDVDSTAAAGADSIARHVACNKNIVSLKLHGTAGAGDVAGAYIPVAGHVN